MLDYQKEIAPVSYSSAGIKVLPPRQVAAHKLCISVHWHERLELLLVTSGTMLLHVGDQRVSIGPGELGIINPRQPHGGYAGDEPLTFQALMFDVSNFFNGTAVSRSLLSPLYDGTVVFKNHCDDRDVLSLVRRVISAYPPEDSGSALLLQGKLYELLGVLCRSHAHASTSMTLCDSRFRDVLNEVNKHFCQDLRCAQLCKKYGYDESYFCRRFKAVTGLPLTRYIRILRLEQALSVMQNRHLTISDVAAQCGFPDAGYFSRCFRDHYGITPTEYILQQNTAQSDHGIV